MTQSLQTGAFPVTGCLIKATPPLRQDRRRGRPGQAGGEGRQLPGEALRPQVVAPSPPHRLAKPVAGLSECPGRGLGFEGRPGKGSLCRLGCKSVHSFIHSFTHGFMHSASSCSMLAAGELPSQTLGSNSSSEISARDVGTKICPADRKPCVPSLSFFVCLF